MDQNTSPLSVPGERRAFLDRFEEILPDDLQLCGVDGCRSGWVVATSDRSLTSLEFSVLPRLDELFAEADSGRLRIAIDIPIGLPDTGPRACDIEARKCLGWPRSSSVFPAPARATLAATSYVEALSLNRAACGTGISQQLWNILRKIREVDALMTPARQQWIREAHPEVVFAVMSGAQRGLATGKKTPSGEAERLQLLRSYVPAFDTRAIRSQLKPDIVARDDIVDAVACLVSANRTVRGEMLVLPDCDPLRNSHGLRMEIVA